MLGWCAVGSVVLGKALPGSRYAGTSEVVRLRGQIYARLPVCRGTSHLPTATFYNRPTAIFYLCTYRIA